MRLTREDLAPAFLEAVEALDQQRAVGERITAVHPGVFAFELLRPAAARRLLDEIERRRARGFAAAPPNSMHEHGAELAPLGLGPLLDDLLARWIAPLARALFPECGARLDAHHGYLVEYRRDLDEDLGLHVDDSEVTLNLCLGEDFQGAELTFLGPRCRLHRDDRPGPGETFEFEHRPGVAVLHAGAHRHQVEPILFGRRSNLILWCRDSGLPRPAEHPPGPWCPACTRGRG